MKWSSTRRLDTTSRIAAPSILVSRVDSTSRPRPWCTSARWSPVGLVQKYAVGHGGNESVFSSTYMMKGADRGLSPYTPEYSASRRSRREKTRVSRWWHTFYGCSGQRWYACSDTHHKIDERLHTAKLTARRTLSLLRERSHASRCLRGVLTPEN